jgi:hypothetical protein
MPPLILALSIEPWACKEKHEFLPQRHQGHKGYLAVALSGSEIPEYIYKWIAEPQSEKKRLAVTCSFNLDNRHWYGKISPRSINFGGSVWQISSLQ